MRERAEEARHRENASFSQRTVQDELRKKHPRFRGQSISDWAPEDSSAFKVPQQGSDDHVVALVLLWSAWAGEGAPDGRWWRNQLDRARTERAAELRGRTTAVEQPVGGLCAETLVTVGALNLEVHRTVTAPQDDSAPSPPDLTPYLARTHDADLRAALEPALAGGPSVLVMLTGDSSTGKTRALYEALLALAPNQPLLRPATAEDLLDLLRSDRITSGTVLWLNESQRFLFGDDGERAAAALRRLLERRLGVVAVGTLWTDPYWHELTRPATIGHDQSRALLTAPATRRIPVRGALSDRERADWAELARLQGDRRLYEALAAGTGDGRVVQHLSGGPEMLTAYMEGPDGHFTPVEHALITAALDARHLGHTESLPETVLADAADGALHPHQRPADPDWARKALEALSTGERADGSRTDVRRSLTALTAVRPRSGAPARYEPTDYLDQRIRELRDSRNATPALWQALTDHTTAPDTLFGLAQSADRHALYRQAVLLWRKAVRLGHPWASSELCGRLALCELGDHDAFLWIAEHADLSDAHAVAHLIDTLTRAGRHEALSVLLQREPASRVDLTIAATVGALITVLRDCDEDDAADALCTRVAVDVPAADTGAWLLELQKAGAHEAVTVLLGRDPVSSADITSPAGVLELLTALHHAGADEDVWALLARRPEESADLTNPRAVARLIGKLLATGAGEAAHALSRRAARYSPLVDPAALADLLQALKQAGADTEIVTLSRRAGAEAEFGDRMGDVGVLVDALQRVGADEDAAVLSHRAAAYVNPAFPDDVADLLEQFRRSGQSAATAVLLSRRPEACADLSWPQATAALLGALHDADETEAVAALLDRRPEVKSELRDAYGVAVLAQVLEDLGAHEAMTTLNRRVVAEADIEFVTLLLDGLSEYGADEATADLAVHAATGVETTDAAAVAVLLRLLRTIGADEAVAVLSSRAEDRGAAAIEARRFGREANGENARPWGWRDLPPPP
ncbi:hypothetical protein C6376_40500 [Streptomyces sp. P3]|nr:hypothetical protein C6376_40500 [Streptomyces sp. P3]